MLFRQEAIQARQKRWLGEIVLVLPKASIVLTLASFATMLATVVFIGFGTYTRRTTVTGELTPTLGLIRVYTGSGGIIVSSRVSEGMAVSTGQTLYVISVDRASAAYGNTEAKISAQVGLQIADLQRELRRLSALEASERQDLASQVCGLRRELASLDAAITEKQRAISLSEATASRYRALLSHGYVSTDDLASRLSAVMQLQSDEYALERERIETSQSLSQKNYQLKQVPFNYENQIADLRQRLLTSQETLVQDAASSTVVVTAPAGGTATEVTGEVGQQVSNDKPLLAIVPGPSRLRADFYVPTQAIGFIRTGQLVVLSYPAYPDEMFGHYMGSVRSVSVAAISSAEVPQGGFSPAVADANGQLLYRVSVSLDSQAVHFHGTVYGLKAGMTVTAQLLQETRPLYQWILSPLYGMGSELTPASGKLGSVSTTSNARFPQS